MAPSFPHGKTQEWEHPMSFAVIYTNQCGLKSLTQFFFLPENVPKNLQLLTHIISVQVGFKLKLLHKGGKKTYMDRELLQQKHEGSMPTYFNT